MKYFVVEAFSLKTPQGNATLPAGKILELTHDQAERLGVRVQPVYTKSGIDLDHYCMPGACWCSEKIPGSDHPAGCVGTSCEYHQPEPGAK